MFNTINTTSRTQSGIQKQKLWFKWLCSFPNDDEKWKNVFKYSVK
jgi:hypothetical protein